MCLALLVPLGKDVEGGVYVVCSEQRCQASLAGETTNAEPGTAAGASLGLVGMIPLLRPLWRENLTKG